MSCNLYRGRRLVEAVHNADNIIHNEKVTNQISQTDLPSTSKENTKDYLKTIPQIQKALPLIVLTRDDCYTEDITLNSVGRLESHGEPKDLNPCCVISPEQEVLPIQLELAQHTSSERLNLHHFNLENFQDPTTLANIQESLQILPINDNLMPTTPENTHEPLNSSLIPTENETVNVTDPNNHNMNEGRKSRKKADPTQWKRNINKKLRMEGKTYVGFRKAGTTVIQDVPREERKMKPTCSSTVCANSKKRNCRLFTEEQREVIYERFWGLTWGERKSFVCGYVTKVAKKTNTTDCDSRRNLNNGQETYQVCRDMFLNTLSIGYRMVQSWVKDSSHGIPVTLKNKKTSVNGLVRSQIELLNNFFDSLPKMPSHYNRQNSSKLYLEPVFQTVKDVYKLYLSKCNETRQPSFSRKKFSEVMSSKNISLFKVKKDKCNLCTSYVTGNIQEDAWKKYVEKKERARREKREDIEKAIRGEIILIEVDFQAVKLAPFTHANAFYYKTKLACHNFTVYDVAIR